MNVTNMTSSNGNKVANQFIVTDENTNEYFQSYNSMIVKKQYMKTLKEMMVEAYEALGFVSVPKVTGG